MARQSIAAALLGGLLLAAPGVRAEEGPTVAGPGAEVTRNLHLLRRATFGPRPADLEEVTRLGREAWVDRQLHPELIPDREVEDRLKGYETLGLTAAGYLRMLDAAEPTMEVAGPGEDRVEAARRRQAEANRLRDLGAREVPASVLIRAVYSRRQLHEVMADFWRNHFNVDVNKDAVRYYLPEWEREVLRKNVFGRFEDFLLATARHPAMLYYLDNHVSEAPMARGERVLQGREREERTSGLNENYARELMELHTVGVDNGYEQEDVLQLALVLTGWGIDRGAFAFRDAVHAKGRKRVMDKTVRDQGVEEGEEVIRYLARHKNTRAFVCTKLVRYLVADAPPAALVEAAVAAWKDTDGDLREVTRAILLHEEFYAPAHVAVKARTPFEFVASVLRVTGADVERPDGVLGRLADMEQAVYQCEDPTGYSDRAVDWMDPGVLAVRWQFARDVLAGRVPGVKVADGPLLAEARRDPEAWHEAIVSALLCGVAPGPQTAGPFRKRLDTVRREWAKLEPAQRLDQFRILATLLLGSPEFQRQ
jgi:uncharacterized protein (DUF1800 family)